MSGLFILPTFTLFIILLNTFPCHAQSDKFAIDPERAQLLKDALGWMTFRKDGMLLPNTEVESYFLDAVYERHRSSKAYRTFVIAFQKSVFPKLVLQENDACNPDRMLEYKDGHNYSVTWYNQKKFTFQYYDTRGSSPKLCDYRQGLICKCKSRKCGCPEGSEMTAIEPSSSVKRCLLKENEICALIDLAHGNDPEHSALAKNLPEMIFNLEKPPSCKPGTQCRFKFISSTIPKCYSSGPWDPGSTPDYGEECTIGLYASPGSCKEVRTFDPGYGSREGFLCYNFGLPQSQGGNKPGQENRIGFCFHSWINYGIIRNYATTDIYKADIDPLFMRFVTPITTPLRGGGLRKFTLRFLSARGWTSNTLDKLEVSSSGAKCSTANTKAMEDVWQYFSTLEGTPPTGQDYVTGATQDELDKYLQLAKDQTKTNSKFCRVQVFMKASGGRYKQPSYRCVANGIVDADGNDGECQSPGTLDTLASAKKVAKFFDDWGVAQKDVDKEEERVRQDILDENPEAPCIPKSNPSSRSLESLEGGECPGNSICLPNYADALGIYDRNCDLKPGVQLRYDCQDISGKGGNLGWCEEKMLNKTIFEELGKIGMNAKLGRGKQCRYNWEERIREGIRNGGQWDGNKYEMLYRLMEENKDGEWSFCDRKRLLKCTSGFVCECVERTEPRKWSAGGTDYHSDYCYLKEGNCYGLNKPFMDGLHLVKSERHAIEKHYGDVKNGGCWNKNSCVFVDFEKQECTTVNTGSTGYDLKPEPTTTRKSKPAPLPPPNRYRPGAGVQGKNELSGMCLMICMAVGMTLI